MLSVLAALLAHPPILRDASGALACAYCTSFRLTSSHASDCAWERAARAYDTALLDTLRNCAAGA